MKEELEKLLNSPMYLVSKIDAIMKLKKFPKRGMAFCVHHDILVEYCFSFEERIEVILKYKPQSQHLTRFLNFTFIPDDDLPMDLRKVYTRYVRYAATGYAYDEARELMSMIWYWTDKEKIALLNKLSPENTWTGKNIGWEND